MLLFLLIFSISASMATEDLSTINTLVQNDGKNCLVIMDVTNLLKMSPLPTANKERKIKILRWVENEFIHNEDIKECANSKIICQVVTFSSYDEYGKPKIDALTTLNHFSVDNELLKKITEKSSDKELEMIFLEESASKK